LGIEVQRPYNGLLERSQSLPGRYREGVGGRDGEDDDGLGQRVAGIIAVMTLVEITYELQSPLNQEQLTSLGSFANTYGLRKFRVEDGNRRLSFEYDASRLRETNVTHVLRLAKIAVTRKVN